MSCRTATSCSSSLIPDGFELPFAQFATSKLIFYIMPMGMPEIRFRFSPEKARTALHWMLTQQSPLDLHTLLKACYFADKYHLNRHLRPIFGARYKAMNYGPVPLEIYELAKSEPLIIAELQDRIVPWELEGYRLKLKGNAAPNMDILSRSDILALEEGFSLSRSMNFTDRTAATHGRDWERANFGMMDYADMLDNGPDQSAKVRELRETARYAVL